MKVYVFSEEYKGARCRTIVCSTEKAMDILLDMTQEAEDKDNAVSTFSLKDAFQYHHWDDGKTTIYITETEVQQ